MADAEYFGIEEEKDGQSSPLVMKRSPISVSQGISRVERLGRKSELDRLFCAPQRVGCSGLRLLYLKNELAWNRVAFILTKGFRGAIERNKTKRWGRETYRRMKADLKVGYDMVFIFYPGAESFVKIAEMIHTLCTRAGLYS